MITHSLGVPGGRTHKVIFARINTGAEIGYNLSQQQQTLLYHTTVSEEHTIENVP